MCIKNAHMSSFKYKKHAAKAACFSTLVHSMRCSSCNHDFGIGFEVIVAAVPVNFAPVIVPVGVPDTVTVP